LVTGGASGRAFTGMSAANAAWVSPTANAATESGAKVRMKTSIAKLKLEITGKYRRSPSGVLRKSREIWVYVTI
jgi:hypothetical protein